MKSNRRTRKDVKGRRGRQGDDDPRDSSRPQDSRPAKPQPALPLADAKIDRPPLRPVLEWLFTGYFVLLVLGFVMLRLLGPTASGNEITVDRAVFMSVNTGTLTGFQLNVGINQFNPGSIAGPSAILLLTLGGAYLTLATGGLLANRILRLPYTDGQVATAAAVALGTATVGGSLFLIGGGRSLYDNLLLAASAFGNSGVLTGPTPDVADARTHLVLMPLAALGGIGLPVLMELYDLAIGGRPLSRHSRIVLWLTAAFYVGGTVLLVAVRESFWDTLLAGLTGGGWTMRQGGALRYAVASSSAAAVNARTFGLPMEYANFLPRTAQWVVLALMAVGGSPAGTAGGLKTTTVWQLVRGARAALAGRPPGRLFGIAAAWLGTYLLVVAAGFLLLLVQAPQVPADQVLFLSVSAASNAGLSHDALSLVVGPLFTLSLLMVAGRALPLLVLWWTAETTAGGEAEVLVA